MDTREYTTIDKSIWGDGPWLAEVDKRQWQDEVTGLPCLIVRNPSGGHLCGYVGVSRSHTSHGKSYDEMGYIDIHGGLTFSSPCSHGSESTGICHVPGEGEPDDVWWFGFDCAHAWDMSPGYRARYGIQPPLSGEIYRDVSFVTDQCRLLAQQLS